MRSTLSRRAKEMDHRVRVIGVLSAVEHISNETAMHPRAQASDRLARANRASHGPRVKTNERGKRKVPKGCTRVKHRKLVYQVLKKFEIRDKSSKTQEFAQTRVTDNFGSMMAGVVMIGMVAGMVMNRMMTGSRLDGTQVVNKRVTIPQAHFHLEVLIPVPCVVRSGLNG